MAYLKGTHGATGSKASNPYKSNGYNYNSASKDNSAAAQKFRDQNAKTTKPKNSNSGGHADNDGGYSYNYAAAKEAERKAKIAEYEKIRTGTTITKQLLSKAKENMLDVINLFNGNKLSGKKVESFINMIKNGIEEINITGEKLNVIEDTATQKEIELGEIPNTSNSEKFNKNEPLRNGTYTGGIFSYDTDVIRNLVLPTLASAEESARKAKETVSGLPKNVEGCEDVNNVSPQIADTESIIKAISKDIEKEAEIVEQTEKKNIGIIEGLTNWITGLFNKKTGDDKKEQSGTYVDLSQHPASQKPLEDIKDNSPTIKKEKDPYTARRENENAKHYLGIAAENYDVETDGKTTDQVINEVTIKGLAKEKDIDTNGKAIEDIFEELTEKYDIEKTKTEFIKHDTSGGLTCPMGLNYNAPGCDLESWYYDWQDPKDLSALEEFLNGEFCGFDLKITTREDGVFVASGTTPDGRHFKDKVVVATDIEHPSNPDGVYKRGDFVVTSLGPGIVLDTCGQSIIEQDAYGTIRFDIATAWAWEEGPYRQKALDGTLPIVTWEEEVTVKKSYDEILQEILEKESGTPVVEAMKKIDESIQNVNSSLKSTNIKFSKDEEQTIKTGDVEKQTGTEKNKPSFSKDISYENQYYNFDGKRIEGYSLMLPSSYTGEEALPLVVYLHGLSHANWKPEYFMENSGIQAVLTDNESVLKNPNVIVLSPQLHDGLDTDADHPWTCPESAEELKALVDDIVASYNIDTNKQTIMRT